MSRMTRSPKINLRLTPEVLAAIESWCKAQGVSVSSLLRDAALEKIGRADLIDAMPLGRPKRPPEPPPKRQRKAK